jgi:hypothetical protein
MNCESVGCYWYDNSCHYIEKTSNCSSYNYSEDCVSVGCFYYTTDERCYSTPNCSLYYSKQQCDTVYCSWYNNSCHFSDYSSTCSNYIHKEDCDFAATNGLRCYWLSQSTCNVSEDCGKDTPQECVAVGCWWYLNDCHSAPYCSSNVNEKDCNSWEGCYWYNHKCHSVSSCEQYSSGECTSAKCYWYENSCHSGPENCTFLKDSSLCDEHNCFWDEIYQKCSTKVERECETIINGAECRKNGCYFYILSYDDTIPTCHSEPGDKCTGIFERSKCKEDKCYWVGGYCTNSRKALTFFMFASIGLGVAVVIFILMIISYCFCYHSKRFFCWWCYCCLKKGEGFFIFFFFYFYILEKDKDESAVDVDMSVISNGLYYVKFYNLFINYSCYFHSSSTFRTAEYFITRRGFFYFFFFLFLYYRKRGRWKCCGYECYFRWFILCELFLLYIS